MKDDPGQRRALARGLLVFAALQLADVPLTAIALSRGSVEVNPLMRALLAGAHGFIVAEALKLAMIAGLAYTTSALWRVYPRFARGQLVALVVVSALLVADSLVNILRAT